MMTGFSLSKEVRSMNVRKDCFYYEYNISTNTDCCTCNELGICQCSDTCEDYVDREEMSQSILQILERVY